MQLVVGIYSSAVYCMAADARAAVSERKEKYSYPSWPIIAVEVAQDQLISQQRHEYARQIEYRLPVSEITACASRAKHADMHLLSTGMGPAVSLQRVKLETSNSVHR